jgi:hypothetical protein
VHTFFLFLLFFHSWMRWLVLLLLLATIFAAAIGLRRGGAFSARHNALRHWTATVAHIQLLLGMALYLQSPLAAWARRHPAEALRQREALFFGVLHLAFMLPAIVVLTIGSALAKRRPNDRARFRTLLAWYTAALLLILLAIPWPGSPLASRALFRGF